MNITSMNYIVYIIYQSVKYKCIPLIGK